MDTVRNKRGLWTQDCPGEELMAVREALRNALILAIENLKTILKGRKIAIQYPKTLIIINLNILKTTNIMRITTTSTTRKNRWSNTAKPLTITKRHPMKGQQNRSMMIKVTDTSQKREEPLTIILKTLIKTRKETRKYLHLRWLLLLKTKMETLLSMMNKSKLLYPRSRTEKSL
jgi:hypothetical protein